MDSLAETIDYYRLAVDWTDRLKGRIRAIWGLHADGATLRWIAMTLRGRYHRVSLRYVHDVVATERERMLARASGKRGRGRPLKPGGYQVGGVVVSVRLSDDQVRALDALAAHLGCSARVAIRAAILTAARSL